MKNKKIAVLIPCFNESKTIEKIIKDYQESLPNADIYVYDNNSSDKKLMKLLKSRCNCKI